MKLHSIALLTELITIRYNSHTLSSLLSSDELTTLFRTIAWACWLLSLRIFILYSVLRARFNNKYSEYQLQVHKDKKPKCNIGKMSEILKTVFPCMFNLIWFNWWLAIKLQSWQLLTAWSRFRFLWLHRPLEKATVRSPVHLSLSIFSVQLLKFLLQDAARWLTRLSIN